MSELEGIVVELHAVGEGPAPELRLRRGLKYLLRACGLRAYWPRKTGSNMDFGQALGRIKSGGRVRRTGWNGKGMYIQLQRPDVHSKMTLPYIYMSTVQGDLVPWLASQTDLLAEDWEVVFA